MKERFLTRMTISSINQTESGLEISFACGTTRFYSWFWLRDHGEDEASLDPDTKQRRVDTFALPDSVKAKAIDLDENGDQLFISWADTHTKTLIKSASLAALFDPAPRSVVSWRSCNMLDTLPGVSYDEATGSLDGRRRLLKNIRQFGFTLVDGVPSTKEATRDVAGLIGYVRETIFGGLWELSSELTEHADTAYSTSYLEPHTDATYSDDAPGLQAFHCIEFSGTGGESVQVDGFAIAEEMRKEVPDYFKTLCEVSVPGRYIEPGVHLHAERPPFKLDEQGQLLQVSFNNYDRAPFWLPEPVMSEFYAAYGDFHQRVCDQRNWLKIPLRPGMMLIFDNWRNLHGRMGYTGRREFYGCYLNQEDLLSACRVCQVENAVSF